MNISDKLASSMVKAKPPLKKLGLSRIGHIETTTLSMLFESFSSIEDFQLNVISLVDSPIDIISPCLTKLTRIDLCYCRELSNHCFFVLTNSCHLLEEIKMDHTRVKYGDISQISLRKHVKIRSLSLSESYLDDETLEVIARVCSNLQFLNISSCYCLTGKGIRELFNSCSFLTHLEITRLRVKDIFGQFFEGRTVNLKGLRAAYSKMGDEGMGEIGRLCKDLEFLDTEDCEGVTNIGLMDVRNCKKLEKINLMRCGNLNIEYLNMMVQTRPSLRKIKVHLDFVPSEAQRILFMTMGAKL